MVTLQCQGYHQLLRKYIQSTDDTEYYTLTPYLSYWHQPICPIIQGYAEALSRLLKWPSITHIFSFGYTFSSKLFLLHYLLSTHFFIAFAFSCLLSFTFSFLGLKQWFLICTSWPLHWGHQRPLENVYLYSAIRNGNKLIVMK